MSNSVKDLNVAIETLIRIRDNNCEVLEDKNTLAYVCNILEDLAVFIENTRRD